MTDEQWQEIKSLIDRLHAMAQAPEHGLISWWMMFSGLLEQLFKATGRPSK